MNQRWKIPQAHVSDKQEPLLEVVPIIEPSLSVIPTFWMPTSFYRCNGPNVWIDAQHGDIVDTLRDMRIVEVIIHIIMAFTGFDHIGSLASNLFSLWISRGKCCDTTPTVSVQLHSSMSCWSRQWLILNHRFDSHRDKQVMHIDVMLCHSEILVQTLDRKDTPIGWHKNIHYLDDIAAAFGEHVVVVARLLKLDQVIWDDAFPAFVADNYVVQLCAANLVKSLDVPPMEEDVVSTIGKKRTFGTMENE